MFGVLDTRVIDYYKNSDSLYLGKFITDEDTQKRLVEFIKSEYLAKNLPIGKDVKSAGMQLFRDKFEGLLEGEEWKMSRIISTTVNTMRNTAAVMYMSDASVERFEIRGINDSLQCAWCGELQGKQFTVAKAVENINSLVSSSPTNVASVKPFITSEYTPEELRGLTQETLDTMGLVVPAHCNCRDTIIAVI